jgi:hypothetical protein
MIEEWFVLINGNQEGPYNLNQLKKDPRLTPDTLVWKKGFKDWIAIRHVLELQEIFEDETPPHSQEEKFSPTPLISEQEALTLQTDPSPFFLWILFFILILLYVFYQLKQF